MCYFRTRYAHAIKNFYFNVFAADVVEACLDFPRFSGHRW